MAPRRGPMVSGTSRLEPAVVRATRPTLCSGDPSLVYTGAGDNSHIHLRLVSAALVCKIRQTEKDGVPGGESAFL